MRCTTTGTNYRKGAYENYIVADICCGFTYDEGKELYDTNGKLTI
ncbi:MAG: hypothetical protein SOW36_01210 [Porphyromonas sp.]|nr:hypothetical protein [Porphyromonas sp.]MDY3111246.1 hypothetical protein [Porphyromonas sp.]MDY4245307.1 hypothetical protein [Porphyromonas sp.]